MIQSDMNVFVDLYQNIELTYVHLVKICCSYTNLIPKTTKLLEFPGAFFGSGKLPDTLPLILIL